MKPHLININLINFNVYHTSSNAKPKIKGCIWHIKIDFLH